LRENDYYVEASFMMMNQVVLMMRKKAQKNDFKIESTSSRSSLISRFIRRNQEDSRFKKSWFQDSRKDIKKNEDSREDEFKIQEKKSRSNKSRFHKGNIEKDFSKTKHSTILFYKRVFSNFSKLPEYSLSGNRLPVSCNWLPVIKFDFKKFLT